jgi:hypothetical protein
VERPDSCRPAVARFTGSKLMRVCTWGSAALHPRAGSPAEHLGWGARLYAFARYAGYDKANPFRTCCELSLDSDHSDFRTPRLNP